MVVALREAGHSFTHRESSPERMQLAATQFVAGNLLAGLRLPVARSEQGTLQSLIQQSSIDRIPTQAISTVSTAKRTEFSEQFVDEAARNQHHEYWLGIRARDVLSKSSSKRHRAAYEDLLSIPVSSMQDAAKKEAVRIEKAGRPRRRKPGEPIPADVLAQVSAYQAFLEHYKTQQGAILSPQEENFLSQQSGQPSKELIEQSLAWEKVKDSIHTAIYVPFLQTETNSEALVGFVVGNYKGKHGKIKLDEIAEEANLLYDDFRDMTAQGHVVVGAICARAVVESANQSRAAQWLPATWGQVSVEHVQELRDVAAVVRKDYADATSGIREDIHVLTRGLTRIAAQVEEDLGPLQEKMSPGDVANRTETIIQQYVRPVIDTVTRFTQTPEGEETVLHRDLLYLMAHYPDIVSLSNAVRDRPPREQMKRIAQFRQALMQVEDQSPLASQYSIEYVLHSQQGARSGGPVRHIERILHASHAFEHHLTTLKREKGLLGEEIAHLIRSSSVEAYKGAFDFVGFGKTEFGPRAVPEGADSEMVPADPRYNRDSFFSDPRFNFIMAADGMGEADLSQQASQIMAKACQEYLEGLWQQGVRYPLTEDDAITALQEMVRLAAEGLYEKLQQDHPDLYAHIFAAPDPDTNEPRHHLELLDLFGTTFVGLMPFKKDGLEYVAVASVGDSRAYMRRADGTFKQITRDHSALWSFFGDYEDGAAVLDGILSRFDGDMPADADKVTYTQLVRQAIRQEVEQVPDAEKEQVIADMIDILADYDFSMTYRELRTSEGSYKRRLLELKELLGDDGLDNVVTLDDKVTAVAMFFFKDRNRISRFITARSGYLDKDDIIAYEMNPGDEAFVATDAIADTLSERKIVDILREEGSLQERIDNLFAANLAALGCERVSNTYVRVQQETISVRGKEDDGMTFGGIQMTRRLKPALGQVSDEEEDLLAAA